MLNSTSPTICEAIFRHGRPRRDRARPAICATSWWFLTPKIWRESCGASGQERSLAAPGAPQRRARSCLPREVPCAWPAALAPPPLLNWVTAVLSGFQGLELPFEGLLQGGPGAACGVRPCPGAVALAPHASGGLPRTALLVPCIAFRRGSALLERLLMTLSGRVCGARFGVWRWQRHEQAVGLLW